MTSRVPRGVSSYGNPNVCSTAYSVKDQESINCLYYWPFVRGIHLWPKGFLKKDSNAESVSMSWHNHCSHFSPFCYHQSRFALHKKSRVVTKPLPWTLTTCLCNDPRGDLPSPWIKCGINPRRMSTRVYHGWHNNLLEHISSNRLCHKPPAKLKHQWSLLLTWINFNPSMDK